MDANLTNRYSLKTLEELKILLRERKLLVTGKKKSLVDRLVFNDAIGKIVEPEPEFHMTTPEASLYKDLHAGLKDVFPLVTKDRILDFLNCCGKDFDPKIEQLYKERYVRFIRATTKNGSNIFFVKACVWAEMRKATFYGVDVSLNRDGVIIEAQCECAVGQGPTAHCKHVLTVLHGVSCFKARGDVLTEMTCTQELQTFHRATPHKGSPIKMRDFGEVRGKTKPLIYDPRPLKRRNVPGKEDLWRNMIINRQDETRRPIMQIFPPADIKSIAHDRDYMKLSMEDDFLIKFKLSKITEVEIEEIEEATRSQSDSKLWKSERAKRLTASNFGTICKATERRDINGLIKSLISPSMILSQAVNHGKKFEKIAVQKFEMVTGLQSSKCGFFISKENPVLGASPDAILDNDILLEVKCPFSARNHEINVATVPYLLNSEISNSLELKKNHSYYYQVQGEMFCAKKKHCKFVVYTFKDIQIIDIPYDDLFVSSMLEKLDYFLLHPLSSCYSEEVFL